LTEKSAPKFILLEICMENKKANHCIACSVTNCAHHAGMENFCSLDRVVIGTHEKNPTVVQCVDCESFVLSPKSACGENSTCR